MSLEDQHLTPQNALENEQRFVLGTTEGLKTFLDFLVSEEGQIDALNPSLTVEDLALPVTVETNLKQLRLEYKELVRLSKEGLQTEAEELAETVVASIANQYQVYIRADEIFSLSYVAYEEAQENKQLSKNAPDMAEKNSAQSSAQTREFPSEPENTAGEDSTETERNEAVFEGVASLQNEISAQYADIKKTYDTAWEKSSKDQQSPETEKMLEALRELHTRASAIQHKATKNDELNPEPSVDDLKNYVRSMNRIHSSINSLVSSKSEELTQDEASDESNPDTVEPQVEVEVEVESESEKVFGMRLPQAGPKGAFAARSFRDGLEIIKRNHPNIKDNPEKTALANSIVRTLFVVPASGLTEEQVTEVTSLAQELSASGNEVHEAPNVSITHQETAPDNVEAESQSEADNEGETVDSMNTTSDEVEDWTSDEKTKKRGSMKVEEDSQDSGDIKIIFANRVADKAEKNINLSDDSVVSAIDQLTHSEHGNSVIGEVEQIDSINNSIPVQVVRDSAKRETAREDSLTGTYLSNNPQYQTFFEEHEISSAAVEKKVRDIIKRIDSKEIDFFESKFDDPYKSAFSHIQKMTLRELEDFNGLPLGERKQLIAEEGVKYEAHLAWMDMFKLLVQTVTVEPEMKFEELFVLWVAESEMMDYRAGTHDR